MTYFMKLSIIIYPPSFFMGSEFFPLTRLILYFVLI